MSRLRKGSWRQATNPEADPDSDPEDDPDSAPEDDPTPSPMGSQSFPGCTDDESALLQGAIDRSVALIEGSHSEYAWLRFFGDKTPIRESANDILIQIHDALLELGAAAEAVSGMEVGNLEFGCTVMSACEI